MRLVSCDYYYLLVTAGGFETPVVKQQTLPPVGDYNLKFTAPNSHGRPRKNSGKSPSVNFPDPGLAEPVYIGIWTVPYMKTVPEIITRWGGALW